MSEKKSDAVTEATSRMSKKAIDYVLDYETRRVGKEPLDVSPKRLGYDLESGDRKIEVKAQKRTWDQLRSFWLYLTENEVDKATHLYIVCNVNDKPDLHIFELAEVPLRAIKAEVKYVLRVARCRDSESKETKRA